MQFHGRVALVTGAGSGIGKAAAVALLKDGWRVVLAGRRPERLDEAMKEAAQGASQALAVPTDVTDPAAVRSLWLSARSRRRRIEGSRSGPPR